MCVCVSVRVSKVASNQCRLTQLSKNAIAQFVKYQQLHFAILLCLFAAVLYLVETFSKYDDKKSNFFAMLQKLRQVWYDENSNSFIEIKMKQKVHRKSYRERRKKAIYEITMKQGNNWDMSCTICK